VDTDGEILGHVASHDGLNDRALKSLTEVLEFSVLIDLSTVEETAGPGEHGGDGVGGGLTTLLVNAVMAGDGAVGGLGLDAAISSLEHGGHETERAVALGDNIGLHITIVVLAGPDEATAGLDGVGDHIVDEAMLVPEASSLKLSLVFGLVDLLEDILEATIVFLQDGVLGGEVARVVAGESVLHARVGEAEDGLVSVVHAEHDTGALELVHVEVGGIRAVLGRESHGERSWHLGAEVSRFVLITEGVSTDNDGLGPARDKFGDVADNNGLAEDGATDDVPDGTVG